MVLSKEQVTSLKEQIIKQIKASFPEDKQEPAIEYISALNEEQLEEFLKKNKMIRESDADSEDGQNNCIFCLIAEKKIKSAFIYEDKDFIGVLELNPVSKGHSILIPKKHIEKAKELPKRAEEIAEIIGKHLTKTLKAKDFKIQSSEELNHAVINIIPIYEEKLETKRKKSSPKELEELASTIGKIKEDKPEKKEVKEIEEAKQPEEKKAPEIIKLPRRIP